MPKIGEDITLLGLVVELSIPSLRFSPPLPLVPWLRVSARPQGVGLSGGLGYEADITPDTPDQLRLLADACQAALAEMAGREQALTIQGADQASESSAPTQIQAEEV